VIRVLLGKEVLADPHADQTVGGVLVVLAALIFYDVALPGERELVNVIEEKCHAVALQPEGKRQLVFRHRFEVVRSVGVRRSVDVARADALELAEVRVLGHVLRALKHHVLEEVGEAVLAGRLILAADVVPDIYGHDRRAVILVKDDFEAVLQARSFHHHRRRARLRVGRPYRAPHRRSHSETRGGSQPP
jgi:hypothetical protein